MAVLPFASSIFQTTQDQLNGQGIYPDADITVEMGLKPNGVRDAITQIHTKLGAATRAEAVGIALRKHLLKT